MRYLSLCIPTNGVSEWVFPVLDQIYSQKTDLNLYEVIVTDNGDNEDFHIAMEKYAQQHENLIYKRTNAYMFENQIAALRLASGEYLKFINHRSLLENGAIDWMINLVKNTMSEKPVIYLSNGALDMRQEKQKIYDSFDGFVKGLKHIASWTTGVGVWRTDFEKIPLDHKYTKISPHSDVLFAERTKGKYIINDTKWSHDIYSGHENKGTYDLYKAFAIEEISIILDLFKDGDISADTLKSTINAYKKFVADCYWNFNIMHKPCSYKIDGFNDAMGVFMGKKEVVIITLIDIPMKCVRKIKRIIKINE